MVVDDQEAVLDVLERMRDLRAEPGPEAVPAIEADRVVHHQEGVLHALKVEEDLLVLLEVVVAFVEAFLYQVVDHRVLEEGRQVVLPEE